MKEIDWANLSFGYMKTDYNVRINFRNGAWGELEISSSEVLNLHMAATCLHYGQEAFEGLKAFRGKDGKVRIFRLEENAARLQSTCQGIMMAIADGTFQGSYPESGKIERTLYSSLREWSFSLHSPVAYRNQCPGGCPSGR